MDDDITQYPEAECLLKYTEDRIKRKKGILFLFTGEIGDGKSYAGLRLLELWYKRRFNKEFPKVHIIETLAQAVLLVKDFKEIGEGILIEELSVLASSRDSLTVQNKMWNKFLDTVRIKQAVIVGNLPHISFLDKHFIMMCNVWVNCMSVDFKRNVVNARPLWLQTSPHRSEPYKHKFINSNGDEIDYCYFKKPQSAELLKGYDDLKDRYVQELYNEIGLKLLQDRITKIKEVGQKILSKREMEAYILKLELYTPTEAATKMGIDRDTYYKYVRTAQEKIKTPEYRECVMEIKKNLQKTTKSGSENPQINS